MARLQGEISILVAIGPRTSGELHAKAFNRRPGFRVAAVARTVSEALRAVETERIDVALISSTLQDGLLSGFIAQQKIRETCPSIKSVILLESTEGHLATTALRAGAKGVLSAADDSFEVLCRCVRQVNAGQIWANSAQLQELLEVFSRQAPVRVVSAAGAQLLTKREEDIVRLVEAGLTNRQISHELQISEHTVRNNLFRIFDKLGVSTRVELALYSVDHRVLVPSHESRGRKKGPEVVRSLERPSKVAN